jgi:cytochrome P450
MQPQVVDRFDRFHPEHVQDPYPLYERVRGRPPFLDPELGMWIVSGYDDVRVVLSDHDRFSSDFNLRSPQVPAPEVAAVLATGHPEVHILVNQDPPAHTGMRALISGAFSPRRVRLLTPAVQRLADELIGSFADRGHADLIGELAWPLPLQVVCELLGLPVADATRIRAWVDALAVLTSYGAPVADQVAAAHESVAFENYLAEFVASRRAEPRDDLTSELVSSTDPAVTDAQMISLLVSLVFAGHETTANLIGNTLVRLLSQDRPAEADVEAEVEATLRDDPPVQGMFRRSRAQVELGGATIPAGAMIFALIGSANRECPAGPPHLAFGRGVHYCVGAQIAKVEARIAIDALLTRLPGLRLAAGFTPPYLANLMHRGPRRLDAQWDRPAD